MEPGAVLQSFAVLSVLVMGGFAHPFYSTNHTRLCITMKPVHGGIAPQSEEAFMLDIAPSTKPEYQGSYDITLSSDTRTFIGYMIQVRDLVSGTSVGGTWQDVADDRVMCPGKLDTVWHGNPSNYPMTKQSTVTHTWTPNPNEPKNVYVQASAVESKNMYWTDIFSEGVTLA